MFDWLFGSNKKQELEQQKSALDTAKLDNAYNRDMANAYRDVYADPANAEIIAQINANDPTFANNWRSQEYGLRSSANRGDMDYNQSQTDYNAAEKANRNNYFGDGLLGAFLNPIAQTATAGYDLATGQYEQNDRDVMSDLGAVGQTALSVIPGLGGLSKLGAVTGKVGSAIGKAANSIPGMAVTGAGLNGLETLRQNGQDTNFGDVLGSAGTGALFGAAMPLAGRAAGGFLKNRGTSVIGKGLAQSGVADDAAQQFMGALPNKALYQTAIKSLVPRSTTGKVAVGAGALYGGSRLLGGMGSRQEDPTQQLAAQFQQQYGYTPSDYELQLLMQGGY